jgi:hypothetical protein
MYTSEANHFGGWENFRNAWEDIFGQNRVNGIWNGHIHAYERYYEKGVDYMVAGTGGGPSIELSTPRYKGHRNSLENTLAYARVTVDSRAGYSTVQIMRVADVSKDNKRVIQAYPPGTEFEKFLISRTKTNRPNWDLNDDYICNKADLLIIESYWGQSSVPGWIQADLNNDGTINLGDMVSAGMNWEME